MNGGIVSSASGTLGSVAGSSGAVTVDGTGSQWAITSGFVVGSNGNGALTVRNGATVVLPKPKQTGTWMQGFGDWSQLDGNGNSATTQSRSSGVLLGADQFVGEQWHLGVAAGYSASTISVSERSAKANSQNYHVALYAGTARRHGIALATGVTGTWHAVDSNRTVAFPGFIDTDKAEYNGNSMQAFADASYPLAVDRRTRLAPFGTVKYTRQNLSGFTEQGGPAALTVNENTANLVDTTIGVRVGHDLTNADAQQARIEGTVGWKHTAGDLNPNSTAAFAIGSSSFTADGSPLARDAFVYDASLSLRTDANTTLSINYAGQFAKDAQNQSITGRVSFAF